MSTGGGTKQRGIPCNIYWAKGDCSRGFGCRYKHVKNPALEAPAAHIFTKDSAVQAVVPFLSSEGLARLSGPGTDVFFVDLTKPLDPSEVHNYLKKYLFDSFRFKASFEIYSFLSLISNATVNNKKWTPEDGQLLLSTLSTGNGILRINDILGWNEVSMKAGSSKTILSFQRGYLPLLRYFSSNYVVSSITSQAVNALYNLIMENFDQFSTTVTSCMEHAIRVDRSFKDYGVPAVGGKDPIGSQVIAALTKVLFECVTRFKNAIATHPGLRTLILDLRAWTDEWLAGISASPPVFDDPFSTTSPQARGHITSHLNNQIQQLISIVDRKYNDVQRSQREPRKLSLDVKLGLNEGVLAALENAYEGPGELRPDGPRHDNDFINISDIRVAPTHDEHTSKVPPFLPANLYGAPHPLPAESMERLLDIQFRLLREEATASLRTSIQLVLDDLISTKRDTKLADIMEKRGGKYHGHVAGQEAVLFNVYTNVDFNLITPDRRGLTVGLILDTPPGRARSAQARARVTFWESMASKRLMQGGLVALIWKRPSNETAVYLGTIASSPRELVTSVGSTADRISLRVAFFDPEVELRILQELKYSAQDRLGTKILVEATVLYESIRPFLESLRVEPEMVPLSKYLVHHPPGFLGSVNISPPAYALMPQFSYQLSSLFPPEAEISDSKLHVSDPVSVANAREQLKEHSRLDPSQAEAVVDALTRELVLIQGPPGTGKSYTGVELLRVLLANKIGPILMIAFTNHALDHMLASVLDAKITTKLVRLGSRSADERISQFSLENMENVAGKSRLNRAFAGQFRALRDVEELIKKLMTELLKTKISSDEISEYLQMQFPSHHQSLTTPPQWIQVLHSLAMSETGQGAWFTTGRNRKEEEADESLYAYWKSGCDLDFIASMDTFEPSLNMRVPTDRSELTSVTNKFSLLSTIDSSDVDEAEKDGNDTEPNDLPPEEAWMYFVQETETFRSGEPEPVHSLSAESHAPKSHAPDTIQPSDFEDPREFLMAFGCTEIPTVPLTDRAIPELLGDQWDSIWGMSRSERERLHAYWTGEVRITLHQSRTMEFERLRQRHALVLQQYNEGRDEARRQLLRNVDIIGCTTTGAAKLTTLLKGIGPRVMLVEEAGQVLEAHVLGSLVTSIQHLILIGDPMQLRPTINNFSMSMENKRGSMLYRFDMSMMERLSSEGLPMSQIDVQRRMRPSIADLIRETLYPMLEDHDLVKDYPDVRGMAKNVFFLSHNHKENGAEDDSVSKYNIYEVGIIKDLVLHLLRQGPYSAEGDIVVLCAYLGQLARVRDALSNEVAVVIDERDQAELDDRDADQDMAQNSVTTIEHVKVSRRVRLRTVDNFQGEEAKIVILSLVRNSGGAKEDEEVYVHSHRPNIGFLKSRNRTNVALSRAREGLYILGNASDLGSRSDMWRSVVAQLEEEGCIGDALPVQCHRHPETIDFVSTAGQLPRIAPDGGCLKQCDARLKCGHLCPYKCHSDDPSHLAVGCIQRCTRLCARGHPCTKQCADACGKCYTRIDNVELPCGHVAAYVYCHQLDDLSEIPCDVSVTRSLPHCAHDAIMKCSDDPGQYQCKSVCGGIMACCGRSCKAQCHQCRQVNSTGGAEPVSSSVASVRHTAHLCEKMLYCGHLCGKVCSEDHECTTVCKGACRQVCPHAACKDHCSTPCAPCQEPCTWQCAHYSCPVPCGSVCARLPCDKRCEKMLVCGHRCSSVCGEDCAIQICLTCTSEEVRNGTVVDLIMQRTLADINIENETLDDLLITLPSCRHVFTVEALDGHCEMNAYYQRSETEDKWLNMHAPPAGLQRPPTCPTCRAAITSPRYGRVFKRADLDILENNIASAMSRSLGRIQTNIDSISKSNLEAQIQADVKDIAHGRLTALLKERQRNQNKLLKATRVVPIPRDALEASNGVLHGIPVSEARVWTKIVYKLLAPYDTAVKVASMRSSHLRAWEASFSYLYQREMDYAVQNPDQAPRNPHQHAMRAARMGVGQPHPRADRRFAVEAIWITINLRLTLADLLVTWLDVLKAKASYPPENRRAWATFASFVLRSCAEDARIALRIASESESHRQKTKTDLLIMRIELEQFRFNYLMMRQNGKFEENRAKLAEAAEAKADTASKYMEEVTQAHRLSRRGAVRMEEEWISTNFTEPASTIISEWQSIGESIRRSTFYQPVSLDEMTAIVRSFNFLHAGHFYKCPNGHMYVIADCGGANQRAFCPECAAPIGGTGHYLEGTNTRAEELEAIARAQGASASPWNVRG